MTSIPRRRFLASALCTPVLLAGCNDDTTPTATRYATAMKRVVDLYGIPGAIASVRVPGEAEWTQASGFADIASRTPSNPSGHYPIRSVTKSFTVTLVLQLVRDQVLTLEDKLGKFVSGVPNGDLITIADLAGNQSGIQDYSQTPEFIAAFVKDVTRPFTPQELVGYAIPYSPKFAPGASYDYSNTNTVLLGVIVEQLSGMSLAQALAVRIATPLGLSHTSYPDTVPLPDPHPTPYEVDYVTHAIDDQPFINPTSLAGSGAIVSTLEDMQAWAQALGDGRLVGAQLQQQRIDRSRPATNGPHYDRYGLGIGILDGWLGHTGNGIGFTAAAFYDPRTKATIAVLVNATASAGAPADLNFAEEIFLALQAVVATR
jgi:D-alanyl-D-alanine carboxypeptidase